MSDSAKTITAYAAAAVASFYFPQFAPIFFAGAGIVTAYLNKPDGVEGSRLDDTAYSKSSYGIPIPRGYGTFPVAGIYIWAPPLSEHKDTQTEHGVKNVTYTYSASFACLLCEGPIQTVRRIWFDTQLVYDVSPDAEIVAVDGLDITIYTGSSTQNVDPLIESYEGAGEVPAWRGYCYFVVNGLPLAKFGNRRPNVRAEIVKTVTPTQNYAYETSIPWTPMLAWGYCDIADTLFVWNQGSNDSRIFRFDPANMNLLSISGSWTPKPPYIVANYYEDLMTPDPNNCVIVSVQMPTLNQMWPCWRDPISGLKVLDWPSGEWYIAYADQTRGAPKKVIYMEYWDEVGAPDWFNRWYYIALTSIGSAVILHWQGFLPDRTYPTADAKDYVIGMDGVEIVTHYISAFTSFVEGDLLADGVSYNIITEMSLDTALPWTISTESEVASLKWDMTTSSWLLWFDNQKAIRFTIDTSSGHPYTFTLEAYTTYNSGYVGYPVTNGRQYIRESEVWTRRTGYFHRLETLTMDVVYTSDGTIHGPTGGAFWHEPTGSIVTGGDAFDTWRFSPDRASNGTDLLKDVVADLCDVAGLDSNQYDSASLVGEVRGFPITQSEQVRTSITRLMTAHKFGCLETDGLVKFVHFPGTLGDTIPEEDLAAHPYGNSTPDQAIITRERELTFPRRVDIAYLSYPREYEADVQGASRQITPSTKISKIELSEVLSDDEARQLADVMLQAPLQERNEFEFTLGNKYLYLNPYDEIILTKGQATYRVRITQMDYGTPGVIRCTATSTNPASFSSALPGVPSNFVSSSIENLRDSKAWMIDPPILVYNQDFDTPSYTWVATSDFTTWSGANLHQLSNPYADTSISGNVVSASNVEGNAGICSTILGDYPNFTVWDETNTLTVYMWNGTLSSDTDANLFAGANMAIVGNEVIQFGTATLNGDGTYTLSHLLRGRRGTENFVGIHTENEEFVILEDTSRFEVPTSWSQYQEEWYYKAITWGFTDRINGIAFTSHFRNMMPFAPALLNTSFDGSVLTINWDRRTRSIFSEDYTFVPESEDEEEYEVVFGHGYGSFDPATNQYDGTDLWAYTGLTDTTITLEVSDFLSYRNDFAVQVFKISQKIRDNAGNEGRGYPLLLDLNAKGINFPLVEDLSRYNDGDLLVDAFIEVDADYDVWGVVNNTSAIGGKVLSVPCTLNEDYWLGLAASKNTATGKAFTNVEVLVRQLDMQLGGSSELYENGVAVRMHGTYLDRTCYAATIDKDGNGRLWHVSSSGATWTQIGSTVTLGFSDGDTLYTRIRDVDGVISVKWWVNATSEPASWDLSEADSTIDPANCLYAAGVAFSRVSVLTGDHDYLYDYFSLAFDGNTAPTPT